MRRLTFILLLIACTAFPVHEAFALDTGNLIAYPVPFNPRKGTVKYITIGNDPAKPPLVIDRFKIEIFDINGDFVCTRHYNTSSATWNGRNDNGTLVKPGMYIIKATVENSSTGDFGRKTIRILINY